MRLTMQILPTALPLFLITKTIIGSSVGGVGLHWIQGH